MELQAKYIRLVSFGLKRNAEIAQIAADISTLTIALMGNGAGGSFALCSTSE